MAQPVNSYDSYDIVGLREDLSDKIYNIDPEETPFFTKCKKGKAKNTYTEWQTDSFRASADNAHIEGDDTIASARTPTVRLGNYTQIFKDAVVVPDTDVALDKAGRDREIIRESMKIGVEVRRDIERALFLNQAKSAGSSASARRMASLGSWVATNVDTAGSGGSDPTGDGTDARTDGTQGAFGQDHLNTVLQSRWENGGKTKATCYLSAFQMNAAAGFTGMNNQRTTIPGTSGKVTNFIDIYMTNFGEVTFKKSRECRSRDVWVLQDDMWEIAVLRPMKSEALGKTGDNTKRQFVTELTLCAKNEKASGLVADCTTS